MSPTIFFQLLCSAVNTAVSLCAIDVTNLISMSTLTAFDALACVYVQIFVYCYLSEAMTSKLLLIRDIFYGSAWYRQPSKLQQLMIFPIQRSGKAFRLKGLGIINCSLWVFASVSVTLFLSLTCFCITNQCLDLHQQNVIICPFYLIVPSTDMSNSRLIFYFNAKLQVA